MHIKAKQMTPLCNTYVFCATRTTDIPTSDFFFVNKKSYLCSNKLIHYWKRYVNHYATGVISGCRYMF